MPIQACFSCTEHTNTLSCANLKKPHTSEARAKSRRRYEQTTKGKATFKRYFDSDLHIDTKNAYRASGRHKEVRVAEYERIHSDPGRHLEHTIGNKISRMISGQASSSKNVTALTDFGSRDVLLDHFVSQFEPGMTINNHGKHLRGQGRVWHVGHRIARALYNPNIPEDERRCWTSMNLFPQWADENISAGTKLPSLPALMLLKDCWPTGWGGELPKGV